MYRSSAKSMNFASACSAAASFSCTNLSVILDAVLPASILFALLVLNLHILGVLVALVSGLRIMVCKYQKA